jgi:hypothetical protein
MTEPAKDHPMLALVIRDYLPAVGTLGIVLYGLLRIAYVFFYLRLRTSPEEVGYTYTRILSESIGGAVELLLLCALAVLVLTVLYQGIRLLPDLRRGKRKLPLGRIAVRSLAAAGGLVFISLPALAWWQGGLAQAGQTVRNVYFIGVPYLPVLAVQAVPADVAWTDGDEGKGVPLANRSCLMYLGQANGTTVFYDVRSHESLRLPSDGIVVVLRFTFFAPDGCRH